MATNAVYPLSISVGQQAGLDLSGIPMKAVLLDETYEYDAAHQFYSDLTGIVGDKSAAIGNVTFGVVGPGVVDGDNVVVSAVTGDPCVAVAVFAERGGDEDADDLLCIGALDTPYTPTGADVTIAWPEEGIFAW
jgi:hypothetical protein